MVDGLFFGKFWKINPRYIEKTPMKIRVLGIHLFRNHLYAFYVGKYFQNPILHGQSY